MKNYRPICDTWILGRPKLEKKQKYYGAYPAGFLERARALMGVGADESVLHVCSGKIKYYPFRGFGPNDRTLDLDPKLEPDFVLDAREIGSTPGKTLPLTAIGGRPVGMTARVTEDMIVPYADLWPGVLADPPYSEPDAEHYAPGAAFYPKPAKLLRDSLSIVQPGRRVGILHFYAPRPPKTGVRFVACITVLCGFGNAARIFSVYERETERAPTERERAMNACRGPSRKKTKPRAVELEAEPVEEDRTLPLFGEGSESDVQVGSRQRGRS